MTCTSSIYIVCGKTSTDNVNTCFLYCIYRTTNISKCRKLVETLLCSKLIVRCCIYLTTYDWIKSFLKITEEGRAIYGNLDNGNKINTLYWSVKNSIPKNNDRSREGDCSIYSSTSRSDMIWRKIVCYIYEY